MFRNFALALIFVCVSLSTVSADPQRPQYVEGELLVVFGDTSPGSKISSQFTGPVSQRAIKNTISDIILPGASVKAQMDNVKNGLTSVKLPKGKTVELAMLEFNRSGSVVFAQPNFKYYNEEIPDDTRFGDLWGLDNTGQTGGLEDADIDAPEAWDIETGSHDVIVAILDTGVDTNHPDLEANIWRSPVDPNIRGADFAGADVNVADDNDMDPMDFDGHGTHVAGTVGAVGNNNLGVTGVCWTVTLMPVKIQADNASYMLTTDIVAGVNWAVENDANVINASLGGYGFDTLFYEAIRDAGDAGVVFVAAAGNDSTDNDFYPHYPANYGLGNIISVMATDDHDFQAGFSNYGATTVDIAAPGESILSTMPVLMGNYGYMSGTSMAAPHVSGAAALMLAVAPNLTPAQVKELLMDPLICNQLPNLEGRCVSGGRLNAFNAVNAASALSATGRVLNVDTGTNYDTIQAAINAAVNGDVIIVQNDNFYYEQVDFGGKNVTVRSGDITDTTDVNDYSENTMISTKFAHLRTVDPGIIVDHNLSVIIFANSENNNAVLSGFRIIDGRRGGVHISHSEPKLENCIVSRNSTGALNTYGAGIYIDNSNSAIIEDCTISSNTDSIRGGGIYIAGTSIVDINSCIIRENTVDIQTNNSSSGKGAGIYIEATASPVITDSNITSNSSPRDGGGIYCLSSTATLSGLTFTSNSSQRDGGGIYFSGQAPDVVDCNFSGNYAQFWGGGIYYIDGGNANLDDTIFKNNTAKDSGGAVFVDEGSPINITNCLFHDNQATTYDGGAILSYDSSPIITNCTFADNSSNIQQGSGGAICADGSSDPVITNCIFSGNNFTAVYEFGAASDPNMSYNLFYENIGGDLYDYSTGYYSADITDANYIDIDTLAEVSNSIYGDPLFVPGRLGGFYLSHDMNDPNLQPANGHSPAIDAGLGSSATLLGAGYHTRTDNVADADPVDLGYHYNDPQPVTTYILTLVFYPSDASIDTDVFSDPNIPADTKMSYTRTQFAQVELTVVPDSYDLTGWDGTMNDANLGYDENANRYRNIVLINDDKTVTLNFSLAMVNLRYLLWSPSEAIDSMSPITGRKYEVRRGTKVPLSVKPNNPSHAIIWHGTDDDDLITRKNTITVTDPDGDGEQVVYVQIYSPQIINVSDDMDYPQIQMAIDDANPRDIIEVQEGTYDIVESSQDNYGLIINKAITIRSTDPTDPCVVAATRIIGGLDISGVGRNMVVDGLTINILYYSGDGLDASHESNPSNDGMNGSPIYGGGLRLRNGASPTIRNTVLDRCGAWGGDGGNGDEPFGDGGWGGWAYGGGIYIPSNSRPLIENCKFDRCYVWPGSGGNGNLSETEPGHGGSWGVPTDPRWDWGPYLPYYRYSGYGGAAFCDTGSTPEFINCQFIGNRAEGSVSGRSGPVVGWPEQHYRIPRFGGAVYIAANSKPTFKDCYFKDNIADNNSPDVARIGKYPGDAATHPAVSNTPYVSYGGAIAMDSSAAPLFEDCVFEENIADIGGAVNWDDSDPCFDSSQFISNVALIGGAVHCVEGAGIITRCHFMLNQSNGTIARGGAITNLGANTAIRDSVFNSNRTTGSGGAIFVSNKDLDGTDFTGTRQTMIKNCLIVNNTSAKDGGGISAAGYAEPNIINCTIANNSVTGQGVSTSFGGGVSTFGNAYTQIINSIIWDNSAQNGDQIGIKGADGYPSEVKVSYSNVLGGAAGVFVETGSTLDWDYTTNLDGVKPTDSPRFVDGYYLSQDPCQTEISPCVDAGSGTVWDLGFYRHTTNTNQVIEGYFDVSNIADIGFHYIVEDSNLAGDLNYDGVVDQLDYLDRLLLFWLETGCHFPDWCFETDLNKDGIVNMLDEAILKEVYMEEDPNQPNQAYDFTPPLPDPMRWEIAPEPNGTSSIYMRSNLAADASGQKVEYLFQMFDENGEPLAGADVNSGWIEDRSFSFTGLSSNMTYRFRCMARDPRDNRTQWSDEGPATTQSSGTSADDHDAPVWFGSPWAVEPYAVDGNAPGSIYMSAAAASDDSDVQYRFVCYDAVTEQEIAEYNSSWQTTRNWQTYNMRGGMYKFKVFAQDLSVNRNTASSEFSNTVTISGDGTPPTVDYGQTILSYNQYSTGYVYLTLTAQEPTDESEPINYMFKCDDSTYNDYPGMMQWLSTNTLDLFMGNSMRESRWYVKYRDGVGNETEWLPLNGIAIPYMRAE